MLPCNELDTALWTNCLKSIVTYEGWLSRHSNDSNVVHFEVTISKLEIRDPYFIALVRHSFVLEGARLWIIAE